MASETAIVDKFIESWGVMGSLWGISASTARVHALLMTTKDPLSLDEIAKRLEISRGNASMCLKELRNWRVIKLVKEPGNRRDYYVSESDVRKMFFAIARERKRREFDPLLEVVQNTMRLLGGQTEGPEDEVQSRLRQMEELLSTMKAVAERFLDNEELVESVLPLLMLSENETKEQ